MQRTEVSQPFRARRLRTPLFLAVWLLLSTSACVQAAPQSAIDLQPDAPRCKIPKAVSPKLGVDFANDMPTEIRADFNGDAWCDYALGVPYPVNSQMKSYHLDQLIALGKAHGWKPIFNGKKSSELREKLSDDRIWPTALVDLTDIRLVFPKQRGAPFVLGLYAGGNDEGKRDMGGGCQQYQSVHRWDDSLGAFKRSDDATRDAVLNYFYSVIEKPCSVRK